MKTCGIYKIESKKTGKCYVGGSRNIKGRWANHLWKLRHDKHSSKDLQNQFNLYGEEDLVLIILEVCIPEMLVVREQHYIDTLESNYNVCKFAGSPRGMKWTEKQRKAHVGNTHCKGRKVSEETRRKQREAKLGTKHSEETIQKRSESIREWWRLRKLQEI